MKSNLFNAILSMDAYNRGYDQALEIKDSAGNVPYSSLGIKLGRAVALYESDIQAGSEGVSASFYAIAYDTDEDGKADIISYRGTDDFGSVANMWTDGDIWNGWRAGGGVTGAAQVAIAFEFYRFVADQINKNQYSDPLNVNISLTGHSLGGGLAALIGAVYHQDAVIFDNMPFELLSQATFNESRVRTISDNTGQSNLVYNQDLNSLVYGRPGLSAYDVEVWTPSTAQIDAYAMDGEILSALRLEQVTPVNEIDWGIHVDLVSDIAALTIGSQLIADGREAAARHSMSSAVIGLYSSDPNLVKSANWNIAAEYFWPVLYDKDFATRIGITKASLPGRDAENGDFDASLRAIIAYSALDEGERPFGDVAIRAMFHDADLLGLAAEHLSDDAKEALAKIAVQFAALAAKNDLQWIADEGKVGVESWVNADLLGVKPAFGAFQHFDGYDSALLVDLSDALWERVAAGTKPAIYEREKIEDAASLSSVKDSAVFKNALSAAGANVDDIQRLYLPMDGSIVTLPDALPITGDENVWGFIQVAETTDRVTGSRGNDVLYAAGNQTSIRLSGGGGNDVLIGGQFDDILEGGAGTDIAVIDGKLSDFIFYRSGDNSVIVQAKNQEEDINGRDTIIDVESLSFSDQNIAATDLPFRPEATEGDVSTTIEYKGKYDWGSDASEYFTRYINDGSLDVDITAHFELDSENPFSLGRSEYNPYWQWHDWEKTSVQDIYFDINIEGTIYSIRPVSGYINVDFDPDMSESTDLLERYDVGTVTVSAEFEEVLPMGDFFELSSIDFSTNFMFPRGVVPIIEVGSDWKYNGFFEWNSWFAKSNSATSTLYGRYTDKNAPQVDVILHTSGNTGYAPLFELTPNVFSIRAVQSEIIEGGTAEFIVSRGKIGNADTLYLAYDSGIDGWDMVPQYVAFEPGEYEARFSVIIDQERFPEPKKILVVRIATDNPDAMFDQFAASVTIFDDDFTLDRVILSKTSIMENVTVGTAVGLLSAVNPERTALIWRLTDNADGLFTLSGATLLTAKPIDYETLEYETVTVEVSDGVNTVLQTFTIDITDVNEAPGMPTLSKTTIAENVAIGTTVGTFKAVDPEGKALTYRLTDTADGLFKLSGATLLTAKAIDYEKLKSDTVTVEVSDGVNKILNTFTIGVTDVNEAPGLPTLSKATIAENVAIGTTVGTFAAVDPEGKALTYRLTDTADGLFKLSRATLLTAKVTNYETLKSDTVTVEVSDGVNKVLKTFIIAVTDVNEAPGIPTLLKTTIAENVAIGTAVGTFAAVDPEGKALTYRLTDTADGLFKLSGATLLTAKAVDYEKLKSDTVTVEVSDGVNKVLKTFTIAVTDLNEAPGVPTLSKTTIAENVAIGTTVGTFTAVDPEGKALTYRLTDTADGLFKLSGATLLTAKPIDYEKLKSDTVTVEVSDGVNKVLKTFTIAITDLNEAPGIPTLSKTTIAENVAIGTTVGTFAAADPEGKALTYQLTDTAGGLFKLSGATLLTAKAIDFEKLKSDTVTVEVSDGVNKVLKTFTIGITDVNEASGIPTLSKATVAENVAIGTTVGTFAAVDPEGKALTYRLTDTADGLFKLSGATLLTAKAIDYEKLKSDTVTVEVSDGVNKVLKTFTLTVTDVLDLITGTENSETLTGDGLANVLLGNGGNDILKGMAGLDTLDGGAGLDTANYAEKTASVAVTLNGATNAVVKVGGVNEDTIRNIENVTGGSGADTLTGDGLANVLIGNAGNDILKGMAGLDTLDGGAGLDTADYAEKTASVLVTLAGATNAIVKIGGVNEDTIRNIENVTGGSSADTLTGDGLANVLFGNGGNDILKGMAGLDTLDGGAGLDTADYSEKTASIAAILNGTTNVFVKVGGANEDTIRNIENVTGGSAADTLTGDSFANVFVGNAGNDILNGGAGNDTLYGGIGNDVLTGGIGSDVFGFNTALNASTNLDTISDFNVVDDRFWLDDFIFKAVAPGALQSADFVVGTAAVNAAQNIIYDNVGGKLFYDADGLGGTAQVQFASLGTNLALTAADFLVV